MMVFIIITRHLHSGLIAITYCEDPNEPNPPIMEHKTYEDAEKTAQGNPLCCAFGYEIVEIDL